MCVCLQVRGQIECRLTGVSSSRLRVIVCVSAGQRSDRVSFDRCLVELFACDCVCVCRSEVRSSVV